jgi:hypothetical protein
LICFFFVFCVHIVNINDRQLLQTVVTDSCYRQLLHSMSSSKKQPGPLGHCARETGSTRRLDAHTTCSASNSYNSHNSHHAPDPPPYIESPPQYIESITPNMEYRQPSPLTNMEYRPLPPGRDDRVRGIVYNHHSSENCICEGGKWGGLACGRCNEVTCGRCGGGDCGGDCSIGTSFMTWLTIIIIVAALFTLAMTWILTRSK